MLTSDKIINKLYYLNHGEFAFKLIGKEEDFVRTYISFKKYQYSLVNKKNSKCSERLEWNNELNRRYVNFSHNVEIHRI